MISNGHSSSMVTRVFSDIREGQYVGTGVGFLSWNQAATALIVSCLLNLLDCLFANQTLKPDENFKLLGKYWVKICAQECTSDASAFNILNLWDLLVELGRLIALAQHQSPSWLQQINSLRKLCSLSKATKCLLFCLLSKVFFISKSKTHISLKIFKN